MADDTEVGGISAELSYKLPVSNLEARLKVSIPVGRKKNDGEISLAYWRTKRLAKHDAKRSEPPFDCGPQYLAEREARVEKLRQNKLSLADQWLRDRVDVATNIYADLMPTNLSAQSTIYRMASLIKNYLNDVSADLRDKRNDYLTAEMQLEDFRKDHGLLKRDAKVPNSLERPVAILLCAFVIEGMVNGALFMGASSQGFIGGLVIAFALSLFNVGIGLALGWFGIRNIFHTQQVRRNVGYGLSTLFLFMGTFVNFFVAHFRDRAEYELIQLQSGGSASDFSLDKIAMSGVFDSMFPNPFDFQTLTAIVLLGLGFIVFALATYEGTYGFRDRYPDYGDYWLKRERTKAKHRSVIAKNRRKIRETFAKWRDEIIHSKNAYQFATAFSSKVLVYVNGARDTARAYTTRNSRDANTHIKIFRDTNSKVRRRLIQKNKANITPAPPHYSTQPIEQVFDMQLEGVLRAKDDVDNAIQKNVSELALVEGFLEELNVVIESYLQEAEAREDTDLKDVRDAVRNGNAEFHEHTTARGSDWPSELKRLLNAST